MTQNEMADIMNGEVDRIIRGLSDIYPASNDYCTALRSLEACIAMRDYLTMELSSDAEPVREATKTEKVVELKPKAAAEAEADAESPPQFSKEEVRKILAEAKLKGCNIAAIVAKYSSDGFGAVPAARYPELVCDVRSAVGD